MSDSNKKLSREWARKARRAGFGVEMRGNGHLRVTNPTTGKHTSLARTPGGARSERNTRAQLRKIGLDI